MTRAYSFSPTDMLVLIIALAQTGATIYMCLKAMFSKEAPMYRMVTIFWAFWFISLPFYYLVLKPGLWLKKKTQAWYNRSP
jgi:hypothetical protein